VTALLDALRQDVRHALRLCAKAPGFAGAAILTLAIGVGVSTAVFSVVNGVLLRPLPFVDPDRLAFITREGDVGLADGADWRAQSRTFQEIALFLRTWEFDLTGGGEPERLRGAVVEPRFFRVLGVRPVLGRLLTDDDDRLGGPHVAVISEGLWRRRFGADPSVVGRSITLSDHATTIVGVMPARTDFLHDGLDLWVPPAVETPWAVPERGTNNFDAIGRLAPGASFEEARAEMAAISRRLEQAYPKTNRGKIVDPLPMLAFMVGQTRQALLVLLGAVMLVVGVASVNIAGLLMARSTARQGEFALRIAVGAGRGRLVRQILTEGVVLAVAGGVLGLALALWTKDVLLAVAPDAVPRAWEIGVDLRVVAFALCASIGMGVVAGLLPAWRLLRRDPGEYLKGTAKGASPSTRSRSLGVMVAAEVALAVVLLVGSALLGRTFLRLTNVPLGFDPEHVLSAAIVLPESRYAERAPQTAAFRAIVERVAQVPGVEEAAYVTTPPLEPRGGIGNRVLFFEPPPAEPLKEPGARARPVHGDYFGTLRLPIVEGRGFTSADDENAPAVSIVNRRFAKLYWPSASPVGQRIAWRDWHGPEGPQWMTIVGVAEDVKSRSLDESDVLAVYTPYVQRQAAWQRFGTLVVRTKTEPHALARSIQEAVWSVDPTLPLAEVRTLEERRSQLAGPQRFNALALGLFAAVTLLIAVQGLYALLAYVVELRRREMGVRLALGARGRDVAGLVLRQGLGLVAGGLVAGVGLALAFARVLRGLLFEVAPTDPTTYAIAVATLLATGLVASGLPARRASRVDPAVTLREE
jgi:putative ABC transport system permease protein